MASLYYYTARTADGACVRGSIEAATEAAALASLRTRTLFVTSLESGSSARAAFSALLQFGSIPKKDLVAFFRAFATLVRAGVPMRRSLDVTLEQCNNGRLREALSCVMNDIENGLALSQAMARHPKEFSLLFVTMIRAGELGGVLDEVLDRLASVLERDQAVRKRVIAALAYPAVVAGAAIALILLLITSIVPTFQSMYEQMHVQIPWITTALIACGTWLREPVCWISVLLTCVAALALLIRVRGTQKGEVAIAEFCMRAPMVGTIMRKAVLGRLARTLGTLLRSGVGVVSALEVVCDVVTSPPYRQSLLNLRKALAEGSPIAEPLAQSGLYEPMFVQMVRVGEETGALDSMLLRIADYYDLDVGTALTALGSLLEPLMILLLGGAVGFIVAAVFIPLYTLIGSIK